MESDVDGIEELPADTDMQPKDVDEFKIVGERKEDGSWSVKFEGKLFVEENIGKEFPPQAPYITEEEYTLDNGRIGDLIQEACLKAEYFICSPR